MFSLRTKRSLLHKGKAKYIHHGECPHCRMREDYYKEINEGDANDSDPPTGLISYMNNNDAEPSTSNGPVEVCETAGDKMKKKICLSYLQNYWQEQERIKRKYEGIGFFDPLSKRNNAMQYRKRCVVPYAPSRPYAVPVDAMSPPAGPAKVRRNRA